MAIRLNAGNVPTASQLAVVQISIAFIGAIPRSHRANAETPSLVGELAVV
jgi:hypothetical protein